jgi:nucleoside-diphosphate-sugar epimerase
VFGDGEQTRDFTYVSDAVEANLRAASAARAAGAVVNVAGGRQTSINELVLRIRELTGATLDPTYDPPRAGDVRHSVADLARAEELLGYAPAVGLREGLEHTIKSIGLEGQGDAT